MGLFSKKNKDTNSPTRDGRGSMEDDNGTHRRNTLHKRPPVPIDPNDPNHTHDREQSLDSQTSPTSSTLPPYHNNNNAAPYTVAGAGYTDDKKRDAVAEQLSYDDGGYGVAGTRRADLATTGAGQNDPYVDGSATGLQQNTNAANTGSIGRKAGASHLGGQGTMSNQVYDPNIGNPGSTGMSGSHHGAATGAGLGAAGAAAGAGLAGHHDQQRLANDPNNQGLTSNPPTNITTGNKTGIAPGQESFAMLSIDTARAKLRAAEEKEERALQMMQEARIAAQEARETIAKYAAQVEEEIRLAALKQKDLAGLQQQGEHLGRV